jgi:hypothetical protein
LNLDEQFARTWTGGFQQLEQLWRLTHRPDPTPPHHLTLTPSRRSAARPSMSFDGPDRHICMWTPDVPGAHRPEEAR